MGLHSAAAIPAGTRIWRFTPGVDWRMTSRELRAFPEPFQGWLRQYLYQDEDGSWVLCGDNGRFMNHHPDPNCSDADPEWTVTVRDVAAGEELTCNYLEFDLESRERGLVWSAAVGASTGRGPRSV